MSAVNADQHVTEKSVAELGGFADRGGPNVVVEVQREIGRLKTAQTEAEIFEAGAALVTEPAQRLDRMDGRSVENSIQHMTGLRPRRTAIRNAEKRGLARLRDPGVATDRRPV